MIASVAEGSETPPSLLAVSDLHVGFEQNRPLVTELIVPRSAGDWLIVAGDLGELVADIEWALRLLSSRFAKVIWVPGNHELWTHKRDTISLRGVERYEYVVELCRGLGVITPEDPFPVWEGAGGPAVIVPLFLLYDYTFMPDGATTKAEGLAKAYNVGIVASDEVLLLPDPYPSIDAWCAARLALSERRLNELPAGSPTVLVNHFPLVREPTRVLGIRSSRSGAARRRRRPGPPDFRHSRSSTGICTYPGPRGTMASGMRRSRSATRANGSAGTGHRRYRGRSCPHRHRASCRPGLSRMGLAPAADELRFAFARDASPGPDRGRLGEFSGVNLADRPAERPGPEPGSRGRGRIGRVDVAF